MSLFRKQIIYSYVKNITMDPNPTIKRKLINKVIQEEEEEEEEFNKKVDALTFRF